MREGKKHKGSRNDVALQYRTDVGADVFAVGLLVIEDVVLGVGHHTLALHACVHDPKFA